MLKIRALKTSMIMTKHTRIIVKNRADFKSGASQNKRSEERAAKSFIKISEINQLFPINTAAIVPATIPINTAKKYNLRKTG